MSKYVGLNHKYKRNLENMIAITDDEIDNFWDTWKYLEDQSAAADSRVGWSTAFFAMLESSLLALGFGISWPYIWYIIGPMIASTIIGISCLIWTLIPDKSNRVVRENYPHEVMKYLRRYSEWTTFYENMQELDEEKLTRLIDKFLFSTSLGVKYQGGNEDYWKIWYWSEKNPLYDLFYNGKKSAYMKNRIIVEGSPIPFKENIDHSVSDYFNCVHGVPLNIILKNKEVALDLLQGHIKQRINLLHTAYSAALPVMWPSKIFKILINGSEIKKQSIKNKKINTTKDPHTQKIIEIVSQEEIDVLKVFTTTSIAHYDALTEFIKERM